MNRIFKAAVLGVSASLAAWPFVAHGNPQPCNNFYSTKNSPETQQLSSQGQLMECGNQTFSLTIDKVGASWTSPHLYCRLDGWQQGSYQQACDGYRAGSHKQCLDDVVVRTYLKAQCPTIVSPGPFATQQDANAWQQGLPGCANLGTDRTENEPSKKITDCT